MMSIMRGGAGPPARGVQEMSGIREGTEQARKEMYGARTIVHEFSQRLADSDNDPLRVFEWADRAVVAAAEVHVLGNVKRVLEDVEEGRFTVAKAVELLDRDAALAVSHVGVSRSTSQLTNVTADAVVTAWYRMWLDPVFSGYRKFLRPEAD